MSEYRFLLIIVGLFVQPVWTFLRLENITVTQGERVQFRCQLPRNFSRRENILQWKKLRPNDDDLIISINGKVPKTLEKFYQTELNDQFSTLEIFHVDRPDSTSYFCQTFETQTILCQYNLVVLIQPEFPSLTINEEIIEEDQLVTLTCSSSNGNPPPQYLWSRNDTLLTSLNGQVSVTSNSSIYTFRATRLDNQIKYQCQISNQALATPIRLEKYLHVKYRPYIKIVEHPTLMVSHAAQLIAIEYSPLKLTCLIDANPAATSIYWTINGTTILSRDLTVHLPRLTAEQSGIYTCVVENPIGKANQSITLDVQYAPRVRSSQSRLIVNRSNSALLSCSVEANPPPFQIIWFKNGYEIFRQNQLSDLRIDHVERNDSGLYTCVIFNRLKDNSTRNGSTTMELIVQSRPILETTISKMAAEVGQSITLTCRVSGQPKPQISWRRNEQIIPCDEIIDDKCHLRLVKMTEKDFGSYRCMAENLLGREEWTYTIVSRGKPETPHDIRVSQVTASAFKIQFSPSFDGGAGPQHFLLEVTLNDRNKTINSTIINQQLPFNTYEYTVKDLNESSVYLFRLKAVNIYGESPWSPEQAVQTLEAIITADDLPQLHVVSYHPKDHSLHFDYLPGDDRWIKIHNDHLCLHLRQSNDGLNYQSIDQCLPIHQNRVQWMIRKEYPYLKLSICSRKHQQICGPEIEMKEDLNNRTSTAMMIGIVVTSCFLILIVLIMIGIFCCRWKKQQRLSSARTTANKFGINGLDKGVKPIISEPRLQNPYLLYSNTHSHSSPYDFSANEYQQRKGTSSFSQSGDHIDRDQGKDELSVHDTCSSYGTATRTATIRQSPHWLMNNGGGTSSRSGSNPSSDFSCLTQNTNLIFGSNDTAATAIPVTHYGFPSNSKSHSLINGTTSIRSASLDQQQQPSSNNSTPNRMKKLFYEVVV